MASESDAKRSSAAGIVGALVVLVTANLLVGIFLSSRHVGLHHTPAYQVPNFLGFLGVPGGWLPPHVLFTWVVMAILIAFAVVVGRSLRPVPGPLQNLAELIVEGFHGLLDQMIGRQGRQFLPLVGTAGLFIFVSNLLPQIPGFQPPTANLNTTAALAVTVFLSYNYFGIRKHGLLNYLKHFCGPIWWLAPLMFPIEFIGHLARPVSLSIRLFGNLFGEESVVTILLSLSWLIMPYLIWLGVMLPLSLFTATVQTFVFIMLTMVYIAGAVEEGHGEEHH